MAGSDTNVRRPPSMYYNSESCALDEDPSVCGVVYITSEGGAYPSKLSQNKGLQQQAVPSGAKAQQKTCSRRRLLLGVACTVGVVLLLALGIRIVIGISKQQPAQQQQQQPQSHTPPRLPAANATGAVETTLPFSMSAAVASPAGTVRAYTCDMIFSTDQAIQTFTSSLQAAYTAQLLPMGIDSVNVTQLTCNGNSYELTRAAQWDGWPAGASVTHRRLQQLSVTVSSSSSKRVVKHAANTLGLSIEFEIHRHDYVRDISSTGVSNSWMTQTRREAAAATLIILPKLLADLFKVTVVTDSLLVTQLPTVSVTSRAAATGITGQLEVTRTTLDPSTGAVINRQIMVVAAPGATAIGANSSSSSSNATTGNNTQAAGSNNDDRTKGTTTDKPGSSSSSSSTADPPRTGDDSTVTGDDAASACSNCTLRNAVASCAHGSCAVLRCLPGWQDCDGIAGTGCEADVLTFFSSSAHCGGCGKICLAPLTCSRGQCALPQATGDNATAVGAPDTAAASSPSPPAAAQQPQQPAAPKPPADSKEPPQPPAAAAKPDDGDYAVDNATAAAAAPPAAAAPQSPAPAAAAKPPAVAPVVPATPVLEDLLTLYDDVVRITPSQQSVTLDVLKNDNLGGIKPADVSITIVAPGPAAGSAAVTPATNASSSSSSSRQQIQFLMGSAPLLPGQSLTFYYSVGVPGQAVPAPAAVTLIGAVTSPNPSLLHCSPAAVETTGTTVLTRADDEAKTITLPFAFSLYGSSYSTATISSNGWVSFGASGAREVCNVETSWPNAPCLGSGPVLAVLWDDLLPDAVLTHHDEQAGAFIIQWTNVMTPSSPMLLGTFQAHLFHNGSIAYVYRDMFGSEQGLGGSATIGIRGPSANGKAFNSQLESKQLAAAGGLDDPHGTWLYSSHLSDPDYVITLSAQNRYLIPGLALISHPQPRTSGTVLNGSTTVLPTATVPGSFQIWSPGSASGSGSGVNAAAAPGSVFSNVLVAPGSPVRPVLTHPLAVAAAAGSEGASVLTVSWTVAAGSPMVDQFRLFVAADPMFAELLRQPAGDAFAPPDIPGGTRSVDVVIGSRLAGGEVYVLLLACNAVSCRASCVQQVSLIQQQPAMRPS